MKQGQPNSKKELERFVEINKSIEDWLKYKVATLGPGIELARTFREYKHLKKIFQFFLVFFYITLNITFMGELILLIFPSLGIELLSIFGILVISSIIITLFYNHKSIRSLVDIYPLYKEAPENEKRKNIGKIHEYINRNLDNLKRNSEISIYAKKIHAPETFKKGILYSIPFYFVMSMVFLVYMWLIFTGDPDRGMDTLRFQYFFGILEANLPQYEQLLINYDFIIFKVIIWEPLFLKSITYQFLLFLIFTSFITLLISSLFYFVYNFKLIFSLGILLNIGAVFVLIFSGLIITGGISFNLWIVYIVIFIWSIPFISSIIILTLKKNAFIIELSSILKFSIEDNLKSNPQIKILNWNWFQKRTKINEFRLTFLKSALKEKLIENVYLNEENLIISRID